MKIDEEIFKYYRLELENHPEKRASEIASKMFIPIELMVAMNSRIKYDDKLMRTFSSIHPRFIKESCSFVTENADVINDFLTGKRIYPLILEFHPGSFCNNRCEFCFSNLDDYNEYVNHLKTLSPDKFIEVCDDCKENDVREIWFSGGKEPLTNKDFIEFLRIAHYRDFKTRIYTNGVLLDPTWETLSKCGQIRISVNAATSKTYMRVCGVNRDDAFDKLVNIIIELVSRKNRDIGFKSKIAVSFMIQSGNCHEMRSFYEKFSQIGVDSIQFRLDSIGRVPKLTTNEQSSVITQSADIIDSTLRDNPKTSVQLRGVVEDEFNRELLPGIQKPLICMAGMFKRGLNPFGIVYNCEYSSHPHFKGESKKLILGDVNNESFGDILRRNAYKFPSVCKFCQAHEYGMNVILSKLDDDLKFGLKIEDQIFYRG